MKKIVYLVTSILWLCQCQPLPASEAGVESKVIPAGNIPVSIRPGLLGDSGKSAADVATSADLAGKQPLEDQRVSKTNEVEFAGVKSTAVIWRYTSGGTNYLKEVTVNTNGAFEATTVNE